MTAWWFPDNTVLCNFATVRRLDLLEKTLAGRGRWTEAVAYETRRSTRYLPNLTDVLTGGWLDEPIEISEPERVARIERLRRAVFGGPPRDPRRHLGEAQTLYLLENDLEFAGSLWITDDRAAYEYAVRRGISAWGTAEVMRAAAGAGLIAARDGLRLLEGMVEVGRHIHRMPASAAEWSPPEKS